jgi:hypothetical protein
MQSCPLDALESLDAECVAGLLVEAGRWSGSLLISVRVVPDADIEDLFPSRRDRPSIPVDIVTSDAGLAGSADFHLTAEPNESVASLALIAWPGRRSAQAV